MQLEIGYFYTYKKGKRRWTVVLEAFTKKDNLVIVRNTRHLLRYVNPNSLRFDRKLTLEMKLCNHLPDNKDLFFTT